MDGDDSDHGGVMSVVYNLDELRERFTILGERHTADAVVSSACTNSASLISLFLTARLIRSPYIMAAIRDEYIKAIHMYSPHLTIRNRYTLHLMEETGRCMVLEYHTTEEQLGLLQ